MIPLPLVLLALVSLPQGGPDTDTTVSVATGSRLRLHNQGGDIIIKAWDRNQVRIQAEHSTRSYVDVDVRGQVVEISAKGRRGLASMVDYQLTVPAWMPLDLGGMYAEISVEGIRASVKAQTLEGNITLRGGAESVTLSTVNGRIDVAGTRGRVTLNAVSEDILVSDVQGDLTVESVSGDIDLRGIEAKSVDAQTISGEILFEGRVADGGTYSFLTHSGDVTLGVAENTNATIAVASGSGDVSSSFDIRAERETRRRHTYRLGNGGANVDIETFSGDVNLVRPNEIGTRRSDDNRQWRQRPQRKNQRPSDDHERDHQLEEDER
jgi:hypothetical protein